MSENRNDDGTFSPADLPVGQAGVEFDAGFTPMEAPEREETQESDLRTEAARLAESRVDDPVVDLTYFKTDTGEPTDTNKTVSLERAASDLSSYHQGQDDARARSVSSDFATEIDAMRAAAIKELPAEAVKSDLGLSDADVAAAKATVEPADDIPAVDAANTPPADAFDNIEGLEPELKEVLRKSPQARQFMEANAAASDQAIQSFKTATDASYRFAQASLLAIAPELGQIPLDRWGEGVQMIAQSDPVRHQQLSAVLATAAQLEQRQQVIAAHDHARRDTNFQSFVQAEDVRADTMAKAEGLTLDNQAIVGFWEKAGVPRNQFYAFAAANPLVASAEARLTVAKAARYDEMMRAPRPRATPNLPPVTRPGTSSGIRSDSNSGQIASLQKQVANLTGDKQIRAAAKLQQLQRKG